MKNPENEGSALPRIADKLKKDGLPSVDTMRAQVAEARISEFSKNIEEKLAEYKVLFGKFKDNTATTEELKRMTDLSDELQKLSERLS